MSGAGWNLKSGEMNINADLKKSLSYFFSKKNKMNNFYKLLLFKSILEQDGESEDVFYETVITFAEMYFNYKKEFSINICLYNGRSKKTAADILVEKILITKNSDYKNLNEEIKVEYILEIKKILKNNVIGAFYKSLNEVPYTFDLSLDILKLNNNFKEFINQNKKIFENLIFLRLIEFLKISEKDDIILEKEMVKKEILYYKQDLYIHIQNIIDTLFIQMEEKCIQNKNLN